jgi:hypothetical protein
MSPPFLKGGWGDFEAGSTEEALAGRRKVEPKLINLSQRPLLLRIDLLDENFAAVVEDNMVGIDAENCRPTQ